MSSPAALLLHGLTATPSELEPLGMALQGVGFNVSIPLLPGHGTALNDLRTRTGKEWLELARAELKLLAANSSAVVVVGESLGAILTLSLAVESAAATIPSIAAAVSLSLPFRFGVPVYERLFPLISYLPEQLLSIPYYAAKPKRDPRRYCHTYNSYPAHHLGSLGRVAGLRRTLLQNLDKIEAPVLVLQDPNDSHIDGAATEHFVAKLKHAQFAEFPGASHQMVCGAKSPEVIQTILNFITVSLQRSTDHAS